MAGSIDDVFKAIQQVNTHLQAIEGSLNTTLPTLVTNSNYVAQAFSHVMKQNEAIICSLQQIARNTCGTWNEVAQQTPLQRQIESACERVKDLLNSAYSSEAVELDRLQELREQLAECCPPKKAPTPPCQEKDCPDPGQGPPPPDTNPIG